MEIFFLCIALILWIALLIPFYRVYKGPTVADRLLGASAVGTKTLALILLFGLMFNRLDMFIDISMGYAVLNFIGAIAMGKHFRLEQKSFK